jgi:hypothetical protein
MFFFVCLDFFLNFFFDFFFLDFFEIYLLDLVQDMVNQKLRPIEFQRRIKIIPFLNFSKHEQEVITLQFQDSKTAEFIQPATKERKIGEIEFHFLKSFTDCIVRKFDRRSGADGITSLVYDEIQKCFLEYMNASPKPDHCWFYHGPKFLKRSWEEPDASQIGSLSASNEESLYSSGAFDNDGEKAIATSMSSSTASMPWSPTGDLKKVQL